MKFGIDFGTTNTAVCVMRPNGPVALSFGQAGPAQTYVPSVLAVQTGAHPKEYLGMAAKMRIGETLPNLSVYQNFKMLLGETPSVVAKHWANHPLSPEQVTRKYIEGLIRQIKDEHQLTPQSVVVTVPEVWIAQGLLTKREHLIESFKHQGIANVRTESEPLAAASYYLHKYREHKKADYQGHLLVCDCGGGTMDFCLLRIESGENHKPRMTVLERAGNGIVDGKLGSAGVAFDQTMVDRLFPGLKPGNAAEFHKRVREFEERKIAFTEDVAELLKLHRSDPSLVEGDVLFEVAGHAVEAKPLAQVFDELIAPDIHRALQQLTQRLGSYTINVNDPKQFRVLMVGGFSMFYLVQEAICRHFGSVATEDQRFENLFTLQDRALAIAKGAALIANDLTEIVHTCPANVGVVALALDADKEQSEYCCILQKGIKISQYKNPVYDNGQFKILKLDDELPIYLEPIPDKPITLNLKGHTLQSVLPSGIGVGATLELGFSLDENLVFSLHVRDANRKSKTRVTTLGNLMARIPA
jgi:molecular chaperone DnaK